MFHGIIVSKHSYQTPWISSDMPMYYWNPLVANGYTTQWCSHYYVEYYMALYWSWCIDRSSNVNAQRNLYLRKDTIIVLLSIIFQPWDWAGQSKSLIMDDKNLFILQVRCYGVSWWRHQMETFPALLALCVGNSPVTGEFPTQRPVTRSFDVFFDLRLNKRLGKPSWRRWFETPLRSLWRHCNVMTWRRK